MVDFESSSSMADFPGGHYINHDEAKTVLRARMQAFCVALRRVMREWNEDMDKFHTRLDEFGRAVFINQGWYDHANGLHHSDDGVVMQRHGNGRFFIVDERLVLRIKHANERYRVWDHATPRALARAEQQSFPTLPPLVHLDFCYRLDITGTVVRDAMVILHSGREQLWRWQIWGRPITEYAATTRNLMGEVVYSHDDYSEAME